MLIALILTLLFGGCSTNSNNYIIEGTTAQSGYYYLCNGYEVVDSAKVVNGEYRFEGAIDPLNPTLNISSSNLSSTIDLIRFAQVILEPGVIKVSEDDNSLTGGLNIRGTKGNESLAKFATKGVAIQEGIRHSFTREQKDEYMEQYHRLVLRTIKSNNDNFAGVILLHTSGERFSIEQRTTLYNSLSKQMKKTQMAQNIASELNIEQTTTK